MQELLSDPIVPIGPTQDEEGYSSLRAYLDVVQDIQEMPEAEMTTTAIQIRAAACSILEYKLDLQVYYLGFAKCQNFLQNNSRIAILKRSQQQIRAAQ